MLPFSFDIILSGLINQMAHRFVMFDHFVYMMAENNLLKGGLILGICYFIWWDDSKLLMIRNRKLLVITMLSAFFAEIFTILLSLLLPYRARPYTGQDLNFSMPVQIDHWWNKDISSFPSDHATLFMVFGFGILKCNPKIGWPTIVYIVSFILLPRIYLGLHYPSDILAGAFIGILVVYLAFKSELIKRTADYVLIFADKKPYLFYPLMFLVCYQLVDLFTEAREILGFLRHPLAK